MSAIFKREVRSYFTSPIGYIIVLVYLMMYSYLFTVLFSVGNPDISLVFSYSSSITMFLIPVLTMRLFSEERRQKTDQALFTAPVSIVGIVMGKFLAALAVFALSQAILIIFQFIFAFNVAVDWVGFFSYMFGTLLMAASLIAIGLFISALTDSQIVAAVGSLGVSLLLTMLDTVASSIDNKFFASVFGWVSFTGRYQTYLEGIFDIANTVFFISLAAIFVFLTVRVQESKRWA